MPSQAEILRYYGEKLRVGIGREGKQEGASRDAIIFFVRETANLDDLDPVWNALRKMGVSSDVKLYLRYLCKLTCSGASHSNWVSA